MLQELTEGELLSDGARTNSEVRWLCHGSLSRERGARTKVEKKEHRYVQRTLRSSVWLEYKLGVEEMGQH